MSSRALAELAAARDQARPSPRLRSGVPHAAERMGHDRARQQARRTRDMYRRISTVAAQHGRLTWADLLRDRVYTALAEDEPAALRAALLQLAALAVSWMDDIDQHDITHPEDTDAH